MRRWRWARWRAHRVHGDDVAFSMVALEASFREAGGPFGLALRKLAACKPSPSGCAAWISPEVLPLPPVRRIRNYTCNLGAELWDEAVALSTLMVAAVNLLNAGYEEVGCGGLPASAAQVRILDLFWDDATHFLLEAGPPPGRCAIRDYLRLAGEGYAPHQTVAVPLDDTGGVPEVAADVDLTAVLEGFSA